MKTRKQRHAWTKEEILKIIDLWKGKTLEEIAEEIGVDRAQVCYMAGLIRKEGHKMPRKRILGHVRSLVREVIEEL